MMYDIGHDRSLPRIASGRGRSLDFDGVDNEEKKCNCQRGQLLYFIEKEGDAMADKGDGECGTIDSILDKYVGCKLHCTYKEMQQYAQYVHSNLQYEEHL